MFPNKRVVNMLLYSPVSRNCSALVGQCSFVRIDTFVICFARLRFPV